jgi:ubiquitin-conjugating enzyme E2 Q
MNQLSFLLPQYPFEPPFVRVVSPRFKRQTGFVMNGALCMELLTNEGWNPINDIESVIVSIRSLLVVGDGRLEAAVSIPKKKRETLLAAAMSEKKLAMSESDVEVAAGSGKRKRENEEDRKNASVGAYSTDEAKAAYTHLSNYHKKKGWSGWWAKRG